MVLLGYNDGRETVYWFGGDRVTGDRVTS